jgi:hypothetical protein
MAEPAINEASVLLHVQYGSTDCLRVRLDAESYMPQWPALIDLVVTTIFAERPVCFVGYEPPYFDADFADLSTRRAMLRLEDVQYTLAFADRTTPTQLLAATHTQDFKLRQLYIAGIPEQPRTRAEAFVAALERGVAVLGQVLASPLCANEIDAAFGRADAELAHASGEEFVYCDEDGEVLVWCHPDADGLQRCVASLQSLAEQHGWQLKLDLTPRE